MLLTIYLIVYFSILLMWDFHCLYIFLFYYIKDCQIKYKKSKYERRA